MERRVHGVQNFDLTHFLSHCIANILWEVLFGKFHYQNHHFSPKLGLDSVASATPGTLAEFGFVENMFFGRALQKLKKCLGFHKQWKGLKKT